MPTGVTEDTASAGHALERRIRAATLLWVGSVALSRVMGLLREVVIARRAGANATTDVYFAAFTIPDFVNYLLAGGALSITFIPIFSGYVAAEREEEGWKVFSIVTTFLTLVLGTLVVVAFLLADRLAPLAAPGFSPPQLALLARLTRIVLPAQLFLFLGFLLSAVQMAKGQHRYAVLAPLVYNGGTILGGLVLAPWIGIEGFCWGLLAGAFVGSFLLQVHGARKVGLRWWPTLELAHPGFRAYWRLSFPIMIGQSLVVWDDWITRRFGSGVGIAAISWLSYARRLAQVPQAVFGQAAGIASYPTLARQAAEGKARELAATLRTSLREILVVSALSTALLVVLSRDVCLVLLRNRNFGEEALSATATALAIYALAVAAWSVQGIVSRGFYAFRDTMTPTVIGTVMTVASIPLFAFLAKRLGYRGLATASVVSFTVFTVVLFLAFRRRLAREGAASELDGLGGFLLRLALSAAIAAGIGWSAREFLTGSAAPTALTAGRWGAALLRGGVVTAVGTMAFVGAATLFRIPEMERMVRRVLAWRGR